MAVCDLDIARGEEVTTAIQRSIRDMEGQGRYAIIPPPGKEKAIISK